MNLRTGATEWAGDVHETLNAENRNVDSVVRMDGAVQKSVH